MRRGTSEPLDALQPIARAVAGAGIRIGYREIGMRRELPGLFQHLGHLRGAAARGKNAAGDSSGRNEIRCEAVSLQCKRQGLIDAAFLIILRLRCQKYGTPPVGTAAVDVAMPARNRQGLERMGPVRCHALQLEQCVSGPAELRVELEGAFRELSCGNRLMRLFGGEKQAAQSELLGIGRAEHGFEDAARGRAIAGKLGGLGAQQMCQRLVGQGPARLQGKACGEIAVAGADGDHAAREGVEAALLTAPREETADDGRASPDLTEDRPGPNGEAEQQGQQHRGTEQAGLYLIALPGEDEVAWPVGEPGQPGRQDRDSQQIDDEAKHHRSPF